MTTWEKINRIEQVMTVDFESRPVEYDFGDLDKLSLAYVLSIHKSQGSEFPCVVIPLHTLHYLMLQRNLLYTAVTRGKNAGGAGGNQEGFGHGCASGGYQEEIHGVETQASEIQFNDRGSAVMNGALSLPKAKKETELCIRQDSVCASTRAWRSGQLRSCQHHD